MTVSVRMNPLLEKELELAAKRQGVTKSQFIVDAVERALGRKDPYQLLNQVREEFAEYRVSTALASEQVNSTAAGGAGDVDGPSHSDRLRAVLRAKHDQDTRDWQRHRQAIQAAQAGKPGTLGTSGA